MRKKTYYGPGEAVTLKNGMKAVRIHLACVEGCKSTKTVYVADLGPYQGGMYAYNIYGKMVCNLRDQVYRCKHHQSKAAKTS